MTRDGRDRRLVAKLIRWFDRNRRDLPWRRKRTPYRVWVSEIMLQQTTAEVVARRFDAFVATFPAIPALARAPVARVVAAWSGLGYYRRARMLHAAARACVGRHGGALPASFAELAALPGIGSYTAGAIASMGFGAAEPAVDGNVARVWSRFEASDADVRGLAGMIREWIPAGDASRFNEALIELGATVCRPVAPACGACPLSDGCLALQRAEVDRYPAAKRRPESRAVTSARGVLRDGSGRVLVWRRPRNASLLAGFDELPGRWLEPGEQARSALADVFRTLGFDDVRVGDRVSTARHVITRHRIRSVAFEVRASARAARARGARFVRGDHLLGAAVTTETRKLAAGGLSGE